jgi:hypothetical protein
VSDAVRDGAGESDGDDKRWEEAEAEPAMDEMDETE